MSTHTDPDTLAVAFMDGWNLVLRRSPHGGFDVEHHHPTSLSRTHFETMDGAAVAFCRERGTA